MTLKVTTPGGLAVTCALTTFFFIVFAKQKNSNMNVVIESVSNVSLEANRLEEAIFRKLTHPNIPKLVAIFISGVWTKFVIQDNATQTLAMWIKDPRGTNPGFLQYFALQMVDVLTYLHDQNIVHNNVSPFSILVGEDGMIKLINYSLATIADYR